MSEPGLSRRYDALNDDASIRACWRGYEGTSLQQVADSVGLHKSTLFSHFKSKEELAQEAFRGLGERLLKRLEPILAEDPPRFESLLAALDASVERITQEPAAGRLRDASHGDVEPELLGNPRREVDAIDRLVIALGVWLARARNAGVIRTVPVRITVLNLMGLVLFHPAVAHHIPAAVLRVDPLAPEMLESRKVELREFLRGALAPA